MKIQSVNPASGEIIEIYQTHSDQDIERALMNSQDAFVHQKQSKIEERSVKMKAAAEILRIRKNDFGKLITAEMGKTLSSAIAEVEKCATLCDFYAENAQSFMTDESVSMEDDSRRAYVKYLPIGCVFAVMPWNFPFWQVFRFAAPALMAGNVGILKHASNVPGCAIAIEGIFKDAGFDSYEFQALLIGSDKVAGIVADDRVRAVTLTGSEAAGAAVAAQAGKMLKKSVLELGGSDPFIVMPSADFNLAVDLAIKGRVQNNGQTCIASKRYIIHDDIYDDFKNALIGRYEQLVIGDPMENMTDVGPLSSEQIRDDVSAQVSATIKAGATRLCGCEKIDYKGFFYKPGLLEDIPTDSVAYTDEIFGPVGLLFRVKSLDEAIELANDTRFGLGSVFCSQDEAEIERAVEELDAGSTFINGLTASDPRLPFGGVKASGYGRELAAIGMREFMNIKTIVKS